MKIKTSELVGSALDRAVDLAEGFTFSLGIPESQTAINESCRKGVWRRAPGGRWACMSCFGHSRSSRDWGEGGPILTEAKISRTIDHSGLWIAYYGFNYSDDKEHMQCHTSELVAGLRCYVSMRLGDEVEIPDDLL